MDSFALDLSSLIIRLEYLRKKVLENPKTSERMCFCRKATLDVYVSAFQKLLIRLSAKTIKFFDDYNCDRACEMDDLREWFTKSVYGSLFEEPTLSNKMLLLFRLVQEPIDNLYFDRLTEKYCERLKDEQALGRDLACCSDLQTSVYEDAQDWFQMLVYNILALQLNCQNINVKIFEDFGLPNDGYVCELNTSPCSACERCDFKNCARRCHVHDCVARQELISLVLTKDQMDEPTWCDRFYTVISEYHNNPKAIDFVIDYRMFDAATPLVFNELNLERIKRMRDLVGSCTIKNYDYVDFGPFAEEIKPMLKEK